MGEQYFGGLRYPRAGAGCWCSMEKQTPPSAAAAAAGRCYAPARRSVVLLMVLSVSCCVVPYSPCTVVSVAVLLISGACCCICTFDAGSALRHARAGQPPPSVSSCGVRVQATCTGLPVFNRDTRGESGKYHSAPQLVGLVLCAAGARASHRGCLMSHGLFQALRLCHAFPGSCEPLV